MKPVWGVYGTFDITDGLVPFVTVLSDIVLFSFGGCMKPVWGGF